MYGIFSKSRGFKDLKYDIDKSSCDDKYKANFSGSGSRILGPGTRTRKKVQDQGSGLFFG